MIGAAFSLLLLLINISCGKEKNHIAMTPKLLNEQAHLPDHGSNIEGIYMAELKTMNQHINGTVPASATIKRQGDSFFAYVRIFAGAPYALHPQFIASGTRCPDDNDDLNRDGFIDIDEGNKVWGEILISLNSATGDETGSYFYEEVTSFQRLLNMNQEGLAIEGKVMVVLGTADITDFPLVCGVFKQITIAPGQPDNGIIPGPVGPVEEGMPINDGYELPADESYPIPDENLPPSVEPQPEREPWHCRIGNWWPGCRHNASLE